MCGANKKWDEHQAHPVFVIPMRAKHGDQFKTNRNIDLARAREETRRKNIHLRGR